MKLKLEYCPYILDFRFDAGTSRGIMKKRCVWFMKLFVDGKPAVYGLGECAPIDGLSSEDVSQIEFELERLQKDVKKYSLNDFRDTPIDKVTELTDPEFPSIRFALEMAVLDLLNGGERQLFDSDFVRGLRKIPINGLIWMGDKEFMHQQMGEKMKAGFGCIKMKVGAIDFADEVALLKEIRKVGGPLLDLRIDANGAFPNKDVFKFLKQLEALNLHSIEQPIMPRQPEAMSLICEKSTIPIALDEDLIGIHRYADKKELLTYVKPQYIVIKPSLVGGIKSSREWIEIATGLGIGWWITSALESNVGLNAIAQMTAGFELNMHQGLGTGQLYHNNIDSPLLIENGFLQYLPGVSWDLAGIGF